MNFNISNIISSIFYENVVNVVVIIRDSTSQPKTAPLKLSNNLSIIREQLEKRNLINKTLLFSHKYSNDNKDEFSEVLFEDEENMCLDKIIDKRKNNDHILYLNYRSKSTWEILNESHKLDYGCTMTFDGIKRANKRAFEMKNCELSEIGAEGYRPGSVEIKSEEDLMKKVNFMFNADVDIQNFVDLGISIEKTKNKGTSVETNFTYNFTKRNKASLKFSEYLKPTKEFTEAVKDVINSKDPKNFTQIIEEFGLFIPTEVILGGYLDNLKVSTRNATENSKGLSIGGIVLKNKLTFNYNNLERKTDSYNSKYTRFFGGVPPSSENFDEAAWSASLDDFRKWDCIEFRKPISIFQLLRDDDDDLRNQVIKSVGKRIHYSTIENFDFQLNKPEEIGEPKTFEFKNVIPSNILKIIQNKDADCNIFATVIDTGESENDFFTCQVLFPPNEKPRLIIHCVHHIQKKFKRREYKLKIALMVIGYYTDFNFKLLDFNTQLDVQKNDFNMSNTVIKTEFLSFEYDPYARKVPPCLGIPVLTKLDSSNDSLIIGHHFFNAQDENKFGACTFSYCLKNNRYVNLPNFTFYTLIISHPNACKTICVDSKSYINIDKDFFISIYSTKKNNYGPIFLKRRKGKIKIRNMDCSCNNTCLICKDRSLKISENDIGCTLFDPSYV